MDVIQNNIGLLGMLAFGIIAVLGGYATSLLIKLNKQKKHIEAVKNERLTNIWLSIKTICDATLQQQCSISEATIRIRGLIEASSMFNDKLAGKLVTLTKFYKEIEHHPILQNRKRTPKNIVEKLDDEREELEAKYESQILKELEWLRKQNLID